jgi:membrane-associated phospholipid phosphatase
VTGVVDPTLWPAVAGFRLPGASRVIRQFVPEAVKPVFWVITALGSTETLIFGLALLYWNSDRRKALTVVGTGLVALTVTLALKDGLALPRPPAAVHNYPIEPSGYGFPSGHAIASTAIYGGLLFSYEKHRDNRVAAGIVTLIALIGFSRVILGVHYLGDVLVGFAVGGLVVAFQVGVVDFRPERAFALAAVLAPVGLLISGFDVDGWLAVGGSLAGGTATLWAFDDTEPGERRERLVISVVGVAFVAAVVVLQQVFEDVGPALLVFNFLLVFGVVALPGVYKALDRPLSSSVS